MHETLYSGHCFFANLENKFVSVSIHLSNIIYILTAIYSNLVFAAFACVIFGKLFVLNCTKSWSYLTIRPSAIHTEVEPNQRGGVLLNYTSYLH